MIHALEGVPGEVLGNVGRPKRSCRTNCVRTVESIIQTLGIDDRSRECVRGNVDRGRGHAEGAWLTGEAAGQQGRGSRAADHVRPVLGGCSRSDLRSCGVVRFGWAGAVG